MVTFGAVGDIAFHRGISDPLETRGPEWPFAPTQGLLDRAQVLFGNFEFPFLPPDFPEEKLDPRAGLSVVPGPQGAAALREAGFDFLNLAANHVLDVGSRGLDYTVASLSDAGLATGGVGYSQREARRLQVVRRQGLTFGFLCYAENNNYTLGATEPGPAYYELPAVLEDVREHRDAVDVLVVSIHADLEFLPTPAPVRLANSRRIAAEGADIVLEHHPHVPQGVEVVDGALIAYSLGNFVFGAHTSDYMRTHGPHTAHSYVLLLEVDAGGVHGFERIPCLIPEPPEERPRPAEGAQRDELAAYFEQLDRYLQDDEFIRNTWRERCREMFASFIQKAADRGVDRVIEELVGRCVLVAENRNWMEEILAITREHWMEVEATSDPYHRPNYRFQEHSEG